MKGLLLILLFLVTPISLLFSQSTERPSFEAGKLKGEIKIDDILDEADWKNAPVLDQFLTTENNTVLKYVLEYVREYRIIQVLLYNKKTDK
jgi:hypothetical protein